MAGAVLATESGRRFSLYATTVREGRLARAGKAPFEVAALPMPESVTD